MLPKRIEYVFDEMREYYDDAETAFRQRRAGRTVEAINFFRGKQYYKKAPERRYEYEDQRGEEAEVVNFCRPLVNTYVAEMLAQVPNPKIPSNRFDPVAQTRARMSENLALSFTRNGVIDQYELREVETWAGITGAAWLKVFWDPNRGPYLPDTNNLTGLEDYDDDMFGGRDDEMPMDLSELRIGDVSTEFVSTVDCLPDPAARSPKELRYIVHRKLRPVDELVDLFPYDLTGMASIKGWDIGVQAAEQYAIRSATQDNYDGSGMGETSDKKRGNRLAEIVEVWVLPNKRYRKGLLLIYSGSMLVHAGPNPYFPRRLPFVLFLGPNKAPNTLYADGLLSDIIGLQRVTNRVESKKLEIINKAANPHIMADFNSGIEENTWGDIPGQVIGFNPGHMPVPFPAQDIPLGLFTHTNDQFERAKFMVGHTDLAVGQTSGDESGRLMAFATENQFKARAPQINARRNSMVEVFKHCVYHVRQRYEPGRLTAVIGANDELETTEFYAEDFDFDNEFAPEPFSDEPTTQAGRMSTGIELNQAGFFGDTPEAMRLQRYIGGSYARRSAYDPFQEHRDRATREQLACLKNPMAIPQVKSYDIHRVHLEEHNKFRASTQFEKLPPWQQLAFDQHCNFHELMDMQAKAAQGPAGGEAENASMGPPLGAPQSAQPGPQNPVESPPNGGHGPAVAPPPSVREFANMSPEQQRASDQK